jgi:hypothetical protein
LPEVLREEANRPLAFLRRGDVVGVQQDVSIEEGEAA